MWKFEKSAVIPSDYLDHGQKEVCFLGRSNVGKSTLVNALAQSKVARVSSNPGRTRTINFYSEGNRYFVDLPGYGYARTSKKMHEKMLAMIEKYVQERNKMTSFFLLVDARIGPTRDDQIIIDYFKQNNCSFFIVITKSDKANQSQLYKTQQIIKKITLNQINVSTHTKKNIVKLRKIVYKFLT